MNKEQIKDLIASKIAGQGSAVDAGSALPEILNGVVENISDLSDNLIVEIPIISQAEPFVEFSEEFFKKLSTSVAIKVGSKIRPRIDGALLFNTEDEGTIKDIIYTGGREVEKIYALWGTYNFISNGWLDHYNVYALVELSDSTKGILHLGAEI